MIDTHLKIVTGGLGAIMPLMTEMIHRNTEDATVNGMLLTMNEIVDNATVIAWKIVDNATVINGKIVDIVTIIIGKIVDIATIIVGKIVDNVTVINGKIVDNAVVIIGMIKDIATDGKMVDKTMIFGKIVDDTAMVRMTGMRTTEILLTALHQGDYATRMGAAPTTDMLTLLSTDCLMNWRDGCA